MSNWSSGTSPTRVVCGGQSPAVTRSCIWRPWSAFRSRWLRRPKPSGSTPLGTANLLEAARLAGVRRFVLASTCAVYGDLPGRKDEGSPTAPLVPYAASKLMAEQWVQVYTRSFGMEGVILRYFNVYGPRQRADSPYSGVLARWCTAAGGGRAVPCLWRRQPDAGFRLRARRGARQPAGGDRRSVDVGRCVQRGHRPLCELERGPGRAGTRGAESCSASI